ncbi:conjugal transfer protein [Alkalihalobacillus sp. TS-13]|uniref:conjugal transfer protein n=1 Tax=Alkalihalobacillus sp. TS-13 TaxID=2842455 RepID=UPI001C87425E|nr:conjugal transfer protein [Alkalihalobacillus sp. TS-13]
MKLPKLFQKKGASPKEGKPKNKEKKKPFYNRRISFSRKKATRVASFLFFSVIALSLLFNIIFFSKYQAIRDSVKAQEESLEERLGDVSKADMIRSDAVAAFGMDFLRQYFFIPKDDKERKERLDVLSRYLVQGFDTTGLQTEDFSGNRSVKDLRYLKTERLSAKKAKLHYQITYEITEEVENGEKPKNEKDKKAKKETQPKVVANTVEVAVPVMTDGKGYAVYDYPRLVKEDLRSNIEGKKEELQGDPITSTEQKEIQLFLEKFFTSYGMSDDKLPFMAKVDYGLSNQVFQSLNIQQVVTTGNDYQVIVHVRYTDRETSLTNLYSYDLKLSKANQDNNKYFVESIQ